MKVNLTKWINKYNKYFSVAVTVLSKWNSEDTRTSELIVFFVSGGNKSGIQKILHCNSERVLSAFDF